MSVPGRTSTPREPESIAIEASDPTATADSLAAAGAAMRWTMPMSEASAAVPNVPVQRRRLDVQPVGQRPHRQALQALLSDQLECRAHQPLPGQSLLTLVFRGQFRDSPLFLLVRLAFLTLLGLLYAQNAP